MHEHRADLSLSNHQVLYLKMQKISVVTKRILKADSFKRVSINVHFMNFGQLVFSDLPSESVGKQILSKAINLKEYIYQTDTWKHSLVNPVIIIEEGV